MSEILLSSRGHSLLEQMSKKWKVLSTRVQILCSASYINHKFVLKAQKNFREKKGYSAVPKYNTKMGLRKLCVIFPALPINSEHDLSTHRISERTKPLPYTSTG